MKYILILLILKLFTHSVYGETFAPVKAVQGILDLSSFDISKQKPISLDGEWEIYWEQLLSPSDFPAQEKMKSFIHVPKSWNSFLYKGKPINADSFATYRLRILLNQSFSGNIGLQFPEMVNPNRIWVNGQDVRANGAKYFQKEKIERSDYKSFPYFFSIPDKTMTIKESRESHSTIEIILQMHNTNHLLGGLRNSIAIGTEKNIMTISQSRLFKDIFLSGILLIIALYHLSLFFLRRKDLSNLFFSLLCLVIFLRTGVTGENYFLIYWPEMSLSLHLKWEALSFYLAVLFAFRFITALFVFTAHKFIINSITLISLFFIFVVIFTEPKIYPITLIPYQILTVLIGLYSLFILYKSYKFQKAEVSITLIAWTMIFIASVNDILYVNNFIIYNGLIAPMGMIFFIFTQSFVISYKFSRSFRQTEILTKELEQAKLHLEEKIQIRTSQIEEKNRLLEKKQRTEAKDMEIAVKVQMSILPRPPQNLADWDIALYFDPMAGISGDFYDFYLNNNELQGVGIFDVSGHGISSGLVAMLAKWLIFSAFIKNLANPLSAVFKSVNPTLPQAFGNSNYYLTGILLRFNQHIVEYANAGHPNALYIKKNSIFPILKKDGTPVKGKLLGIDFIPSDYESIEIEMEQNEFLILYTDGLLETENDNSEQYEHERLMRALSKAPKNSSRSVLDFLVADMENFATSYKPNDDVTIIILRKK